MNDAQFMEMLVEVRDSVRDMKHSQDTLKTCNDQLHNEVVKLRRIITGESEPERGLVIRVDRLEQDNKKSSFLSQTAIGTVITAIIGGVIAALGFKQ